MSQDNNNPKTHYVAPILKKGGTYSGPHQTKCNLDIKTPENAIYVIHSMLQVFNQIEGSSQGIKNTSFSTSIFKNPGHESKNDSASQDKMLNYFLLSSSTEEFHQILSKFLRKMNADKNSVLTKAELKCILNFFCKKENLGKENVEKCLRKLVPLQTLEGNNKLEKGSPKSEDSEISPQIVEKLFEALKFDGIIMGYEEPSVDFLKLLPLLIGLYARLIKIKVTQRMEKLEEIRGSSKRGNKWTFSEDGLYGKFEKMGKVCDKENPAILTLEDIENVLVSTHDSFQNDFSRADLDSILTEVQQKYKYSRQEKTFLKPVNLNHKFLTFLAFKICLKRIQIPDQYQALEDYIYWNAIMHADKLDSEKMSKLFLKFSQKRLDLTKPITLESLNQLFNVFIIKIFPLMPKRTALSVIKQFVDSAANKTEFDVIDFAEKLYGFLEIQADYKLRNCVKMIYGKISSYSATPTNFSPFKTLLRKEKNGNEFQIKLFDSSNNTPRAVTNKENQSSHNTSQLSNSNLTDSSQDTSRIMLRSSIRGVKARKNDKEDANKEENFPSVFAKMAAVQNFYDSIDTIESSEVAYSRSSMGNARNSDLKKSLADHSFGDFEQVSTNCFFIGSEDNTIHKKENPEHDYLNSCFVKEAFTGLSPKRKKNSSPRKVQISDSNNGEDSIMLKKGLMKIDSFSEADTANSKKEPKSEQSMDLENQAKKQEVISSDGDKKEEMTDWKQVILKNSVKKVKLEELDSDKDDIQVKKRETCSCAFERCNVM